MLKLLRRRSFRRSKDFRTESSRRSARNSRRNSEESNNSGHYSHHKNRSQQINASQNSFQPNTTNDSGSRYNSWDRRSQCSNYRYSSISTNTVGGAGGGGRDSPPEILQYSRPPENLTSPNRESNGLLNQSLTPSPNLVRKTQQEQRLLIEHPRVPRGAELPNRASPEKKSGGVLSSFRRSFRKKNKSTVPVINSYSVTQPSSSSRSRIYSGSRTSVQSNTSVNKSANPKGSVSSVRSSTSRQLLPGRPSSPGRHTPTSGRRSQSPGRPVQVVAPFQQAPAAVTPSPTPVKPQAGTGAGTFVDFFLNGEGNMRDPVTLINNNSSNNHIINNNNQKTTTANIDMDRGAVVAPPRQQRHLPQTPKQASRTGLVTTPVTSSSVRSGARSSVSGRTAVVPPSTSSSAPRPAQRLSLRKVRLASRLIETLES